MAGSVDIGATVTCARPPERPGVRLLRIWTARPPRPLPMPPLAPAASIPVPAPPLTAAELIAMARAARTQR